MVEDDHAIVKGKRQIGQLTIIGRRIRQVLAVADDVVTGVADGSANERRQVVGVRHADSLDALPQFVQWIVGRQLFHFVASNDRDSILRTLRRSWWGRQPENCNAQPFRRRSHFRTNKQRCRDRLPTLRVVDERPAPV